MSKFLLTAAAFLSLAAPSAMASERSFTHEGVTYTYTVTAKDGRQILEGRADDGAKFRLAVKDGWVDGYVNGARVSFAAPKSKAPTQVAQR